MSEMSIIVGITTGWILLTVLTSSSMAVLPLMVAGANAHLETGGMFAATLTGIASITCWISLMLYISSKEDRARSPAPTARREKSEESVYCQ
jgi:hypothetical protein